MSKQLQRRNRWYDKANDIKPHAEVLSEAITAAGTATGVSDWGKLLADASEAFEIYGAAVLLGASEALPTVKAILKVIELVTKEHDPNKVGFLACTLAYQQALVTAASSPKFQVNATSEQREKALEICTLIVKAMPEELTFTNCTISNLVQHPLLLELWEPRIREVFEALGMSSNDAEQRILDIRQAFPGHLQTLLYHGKTADKFKLFRDTLRSSDGTVNPADVLREYAQYHRWLYEERPVLGTAPFSLQKIYLETKCGKLTWQQIKRGKANPYRDGGSHSLTETVLGLIEDPKFDDAIVIQGPAGCGKSAFTLHLNALLLQRGWIPIRILLRHIDPDRGLKEALGKAMLYDDTFLREVKPRYSTGEQVFKGSPNIFEEFRQQDKDQPVKLCPYVVILDGWDEVTVGGSESFQGRLQKLLDQVRNQLLDQGRNNSPRIRVILTGRPTTEFTGRGELLQDETLLLTVRPLESQQLRVLFENVAHGLAHPLHVSGVNPEDWNLPDYPTLKKLEEGLTREEVLTDPFSDVLEEPQNIENKYEPLSLKIPDLAVLESPLLSLLTLRLLGKKVMIVDQAITNPTRLIRALVNETCVSAGNVAPNVMNNLDTRVRLYGNQLRALLQETAAAMTLHGGDSISHEELKLRLQYLIPDFDSLETEVRERTHGSVVASLLISFFFKDGNRELGAEFHHKSFREYLFAECIFQRLLDTAVEESDSEETLQERLAKLLAPRWLTPEIKRHLRRVIELEFEDNPDPELWDKLRYKMAEVWEWWCKQQHLRPSVKRNKNRQPERIPALVEELVEWTIQDRRDQPVDRPTYTDMDSHLGDSLIEFCVYLHTTLEPIPFVKKHDRIHFGFDTYTKTRFAPEGVNQEYPFRYTIHRIASTRQRPRGNYPIAANLSGIFLQAISLKGVNLPGANLTGADLSQADLTGANLIQADLTGADLSQADLTGADLSQADLTGANLIDTDLTGVDLKYVNLIGAYLIDTNLTGADLEGAHLTGTYIAKARVRDYFGRLMTLPNALQHKLDNFPKGLPLKLIEELKTFPLEEDVNIEHNEEFPESMYIHEYSSDIIDNEY